MRSFIFLAVVFEWRSARCQTSGVTSDLWIAPDHVALERDSEWQGKGEVHVMAGRFDEDQGTKIRSAVVIDSTLDWQVNSNSFFQKSLGTVSQLIEMSAGDGEPPNAFALSHDEQIPLDPFRHDQNIASLLARTFGVNASGCKYGRSGGHNRPFLIVQNFSMSPDGFHDDICDDYPFHQGITVTTYPHEKWEAEWGGHFELGTPGQKTLARVAPMPDRTVIFDSCIHHRATNPKAAALPVSRNLTVSNGFHKQLSIGEYLQPWHWRPHYEFQGWRFGIAMQLRCPLLPTPESTPSPLAVKLERGLGAGNIVQIKDLRQKVLQSDKVEDLLQNRTFGTGEANGHETIFLHLHVDNRAPNLRSRLLGLVRKVDDMSKWNMTNETDFNIRCIEYIRYRGSTSGPADNIGWHADGATLMTMMVMLSEPSDYQGGKVEFKSGTTQSQYEMAAGDVLAWRGWTKHRVTSVLQGVRDVLVIEWWRGEDCTSSLEPRGAETEIDVFNALRLDPSSADLHRYMGDQLCTSLPCLDEHTESLAETAYRHAAFLAPDCATAMHTLGNFLVGSDNIYFRKEGIEDLRSAHLLDPSVAGPVPDELNKISEWDSLVSQMWKLGALLIVIPLLFSVVRLLERLDANKAPSPNTSVDRRESVTQKSKSSKKTN